MTDRLRFSPGRRALCAALPSLWLGGRALAQSRLHLPSPLLRARWLARLSWGPTAGSVQALESLGPAAWLARELAPAPWPPALPSSLPERTLALGTPAMAALLQSTTAQQRLANQQSDPDEKNKQNRAFQDRLTAESRHAQFELIWQGLYGERQVQQQMGWFWFNHFSVHRFKNQLRPMMADYSQQLTALALGRFRDLLGFAVKHPAMLLYLDNQANAVGRINENLARELLELHTLGVDGGYTQADVQAMARVLTGFGVNMTGEVPKLKPEHQATYALDGLMEFHPARHDASPQTLLGKELPGSGRERLEWVLDHLAAHPETARHLCQRLAVYWVGDKPSPALVERLVRRYMLSRGLIAEVMQELLASDELIASLGQQFKTPQQWVMSAMRLLYEDVPIINPMPVLRWMERLGQQPFDRQTPDGYPLEGSAWEAPGQMVTRFELARVLAAPQANLFRPEGSPADPAAPRPPAPRWPHDTVRELWLPAASEATRQAVLSAANPRDAAALWLSSPEFMMR
ncbi:DUF1800 domain-containing protein [Ideonella paludis]|uniref:DUF1800 domain-containing protein n=1 Tax=Ideonella paludis TaxID=1233411 RepID=A0ABS5DVQ5_9BURK|nr:DUF1800 domain-containing protein [Ideonella paludis]MBQ0935231.1 DUF1800 domain-containing protein [Ideonella paludis]